MLGVLVEPMKRLILVLLALTGTPVLANELTVLGTLFSEKVQGEPGTNIGFRLGSAWLFAPSEAFAVGPMVRYDKTFEVNDDSGDYHTWDLRIGPKLRLYPGLGDPAFARLFLTAEGLYGRGRYVSSFTKTKSTLYEGRGGVGVHFALGPTAAFSPELTYGHDLEREEEEDAPDSRSAVSWTRTMQTQLQLGLTAFLH